MKQNFYIKHTVFIKKLKSSDKKMIIGIDEAGRGPVLGHMVYGALLASDINHKFGDSKKISKSNREKLFNVIELEYSYVYATLHPEFLTQQMKKKSLNEISYETVIKILKMIIDSRKYEIKEIYLDALGPDITYLGKLRKNFPGFKFIVESKADSKFPIVGGASIIAKVIRDRILHEWDLVDKNHGSGYPSDPLTISWLERNFCPVFGFPNVVRFSWKTVVNFFKNRNSKPLKPPHEKFYLN